VSRLGDKKVAIWQTLTTMAIDTNTIIRVIMLDHFLRNIRMLSALTRVCVAMGTSNPLRDHCGRRYSGGHGRVMVRPG
jgi:hypothetical protein